MLSVLGLAVAVVGLEASPLGEEFQVNQFTTGDQAVPDVAAAPDGGFVVVWSSSSSPEDNGFGSKVLGRTLEGAGSPSGSDFVVYSPEVYPQTDPRVASWADGSFVVQWGTLHPGTGYGIEDHVKIRRFDLGGSPTGPDFTVYTPPEPQTFVEQHDVAAADDGYVVVLVSDYLLSVLGTSEGTVRKKRFDSSNSLKESSVLRSRQEGHVRHGLTRTETEDFVAGSFQFDDDAPGTAAPSIEARRFDSSGETVGSGFSIHPGDPSQVVRSLDIASSPSREFIVVWDASVSDGPSGIYGRSVDAEDQPDPGGPLRLDDSASANAEVPRLARGADGSYLVVWTALGSAEDEGAGIRGRFLTSEGLPSGGEFRINSMTTGDQLAPRIEASRDGTTFLVVWQTDSSPGTDSDGSSISGRRFRVRGVFSDAFESGDTSAWSSPE